MDWQVSESFGEQGLIFEGCPEKSLSAQALADDISLRLDTESLLISGGDHAIERLAAKIGKKLGIEQQFIDIPNPV